ncbi:19811_t:CDS:1, partial [Dentiscutata erythropus]
KNKLIGHLKEAIITKKKKIFGIDVDKLKSWKVEIPDENKNMINRLTFHIYDILLPTR